MKPYYTTPDGRVRLYHGDCREILPIVAPPSKRVLVLADPMYGVDPTMGRRNKPHVIQRKGRVVARRSRPDREHLQIDDSKPSDTRWLLSYERLLIWGWNHIADQLPPTAAMIFWDKRVGVAPDDGADGEAAWTNLGGPARCFRHLWRGLCQASEKGPDGNAPRLHSMQKPEAFYRWLFAGRGRGKPVVNPGDLIISPYLGSGPEIRPTMELGLEFIGIDVEEEYLKTAIKHRIEPALKASKQLDIWTPKPRREEQEPLFKP